jgi:hypothetical protein
MKVILLLTCLVLLGCHAPSRVIEGTFVVNGEAKSGIEVRLPGNLDDFSNCNGAPVSAVTDQLGRFKASVTKFPVRPCFTVDGKIYSDSFILDDRTQKPITLSCKLPLTVTGHFEDGHVCN